MLHDGSPGSEEVLSKLACRMSVIFLAIGLIGLSYHTALTGGVFRVIALAPLVRTGELTFHGRWLFLRQFSTFVSTAFVLLWVIYNDKEKISLKARAFLLCLAMLHVYYSLSTYGRREFWYPIILCCLAWIMSSRKAKPRQLAVLILSILVWLVPVEKFFSISYMNSNHRPMLSSSVQPGRTVSPPNVTKYAMHLQYLKHFYLDTTRAFADSFMHFVGMQHARLWQFGFLGDLAEIPLEFLPSRLMGFERKNRTFKNISNFLLGKRSDKEARCLEPPGLHGYLLVNFGYTGMFLIFFFFGCASKSLDNSIRPCKNARSLDWLIYFFILMMFADYLREGVLVMVIKQRASWWLTVVLLFVARRSRTRWKEARLMTAD